MIHKIYDFNVEKMTMLISGISKRPDGAEASRREVEAQLFNLETMTMTMTMTIMMITTRNGIQF